MLGRRSFLKALGLAPAAVSSGATQASALGLKGAMGVLHAGSPVQASVETIGAVYAKATSGEQDARLAYEAWKAISGVAVPEHKRQEIEREARYVQALDPDLVANRSWSLAAKMRVQAERNIGRRMAEAEGDMLRRFKREVFQQQFGFDVW